MANIRNTTPEYRRKSRYAWFPKKLGDGRWVWLKSYWISVPAYLDDR